MRMRVFFKIKRYHRKRLLGGGGYGSIRKNARWKKILFFSLELSIFPGESTFSFERQVLSFERVFVHRQILQCFTRVFLISLKKKNRVINREKRDNRVRDGDRETMLQIRKKRNFCIRVSIIRLVVCLVSGLDANNSASVCKNGRSRMILEQPNVTTTIFHSLPFFLTLTRFPF